jgi:hypothetical protein
MNNNWMSQAKCRGAGPNAIFFEETRPTSVRRARKICSACLVSAECLRFAIERQEVGIWAGTTTNQRAKMLRKQRKLKKETSAPEVL